MEDKERSKSATKKFISCYWQIVQTASSQVLHLLEVCKIHFKRNKGILAVFNGLKGMKPVKWEHKQMVGVLQKWWKAQIWFSPEWSDWVEPSLEVVGEVFWDITRNSFPNKQCHQAFSCTLKKKSVLCEGLGFFYSPSFPFLLFFLIFFSFSLLHLAPFCFPSFALPLFSSFFLPVADQKVFCTFRIISTSCTLRWHVVHICNIFWGAVYVCMCIETNAKILSDLPNSWEADPWSQIHDCQWGVETYSKICSWH